MVVNIVASWFHNCVFSAAHIATRLSGVVIAGGLSCACHADLAPTTARSASTQDSSQVAQQGSSSADEVARPLDDQQITQQTQRLSLCADLTDSPDFTRCQKYAEVDRALDEGPVASAEQRLIELGGGGALEEQVQTHLPQQASELESIQRFVLARALLLRGSLSYGAGDENTALASRIFDDLANAAVNEQLHLRLTLERSRARLAQGQGEDALALIEPLSKLVPDDAEVQATFGIALLATGAIKRCVAPLKRALELDPKEPERHLVLGTARMLDGDLSAAERNFRGALAAAAKIEREPAQKTELLARAYGDLGAVLLVQGDAEGGRAHLRRALALMPRRATYLANLSYAELLLGDAKEAEVLAHKALAIDDQFVSGWLNLGLAQAKLRQFDAAQISFERAQQLDPSDPRPQANLLDLKQVRSDGAYPVHEKD